MGVESSMYLSRPDVLEPDLVVYPRGIELEQVKGPRHHPGHRGGADDARLRSRPQGRALRPLRRAGALGRSMPTVAGRHVHRGAADGRWGSIEILSAKDG